MARRPSGTKRLKERRDRTTVYVERMTERPASRRSSTTSRVASR
ncbi:MAG TPA: hypothetical protein VF710_02175 [Longimicrobium sp.]